MATLDCHDIYRGPCYCAEGQLVVEECEPDHPFARASQREWRPRVECAKCSSQYALIEQDNDFVLVAQSNTAERKRLSDRYWEQARAFVARPEVQNSMKDFAEVLERKPSVAEVHRTLAAAGFHVPSVGTFRKHYDDGPSWVERPYLQCASAEVTAIRLIRQ